MVKAGLRGLTLLSVLAVSANAHSWVEELTVIAPNGTFTGSPGYPRGYVSRSAPNFNDGTMTHLLSSTGPMNLTDVSGDMCKDTQKKPTQNEGFGRLQAAAGDAIALRYQENGHVTLPDTQAGKPENRGTVYVYGTTEPKENEQLQTIHKVWNEDGTGGDKRGVLLSVQDFDDGQCYQINGGEISKERQSEFPHEADKVMGADLWCQQDIRLPDDLPSEKLYTLYWVWDWPTARGVDPNLPRGKQEVYTTCMDVLVADKPKPQEPVQAKYADGQSLNSAAVKARFIGTMGSTFDVPTEDDDKDASSTSQASESVSVTTAFSSPTPAGSSYDQEQDAKGQKKQLISSSKPGAFAKVTPTPAHSKVVTLTTMMTIVKPAEATGCSGSH